MARVDDLRSTLAQIQASIDEAPVDKRAPLFGQYLACEARIALLTKSSAKGGDPIDELARRRSERGAGPAEAASSTRRSR